jgi:hypothetical protein
MTIQTSSQVMMVRPARFLSNPQTLASNAFQQPAADAGQAQRRALFEFDRYVAALRAAGVAVLVVEDSAEPHTPDSLFPNNWISFHDNGEALLYPMAAENRRLERSAATLAQVGRRFALGRVTDFSFHEAHGHFLEGTGSMVLDRRRRIAYVCHSLRSHPAAMDSFLRHTGYRAHWFHASDGAGQSVYHTNVMMAVGGTLAVACLEALPDEGERAALRQSLCGGGAELLEISLAQMAEFAGNMLELRSATGRPLWAMSRRAWTSLRPGQRARIAAHGEPLVAALDTIERLGGGGARCMLAEIFLPPRRRVDALA